MIRIRNGKRYNTKKAKEIAELDNGDICQGRDLRYTESVLYITPGKEFFTIQNKRCEGAYYLFGDSCFEVLSNEQALNFLERSGDIDLIEEYFGDEIKDA